jgi:type IV pilus assembly protein PilM
MPKQLPVWGIEIGNSAFKALLCHLENQQVVADSFEYIEYPKMLSQPEADPDALISEAMAQFLAKHPMREVRVAISVPGQNGLTKFFKPPPIEVKRIPDIVRFEAKQQIPFDLNDVVWDYQLMPGSQVFEGFAMDSEVGLFAMKREQAYRWLKPFQTADVEVDVVQLAPGALYNMLGYDRLADKLAVEDFDADNPPPSLVLLNLGTDTTDLLVTNGFRIWQRNMPIGGNHFTRQLTKELKLTFAKAEHLKRNARQAEDPKLVFQAMRPVFNDMVTEIQRSVGFFQQQNRQAKVDRLLLCGNAVKLPGLVAYLGKSLGYDVLTVDQFSRLSGDEVLSNPTFKENLSTFSVCYGLCLQGLGQGPLRSSLVPREILTDRLVRAKKPWALAAVAALMAGMVGHYVFTQSRWSVVHEDLWKTAQTEADNTSSVSAKEKKDDADLEAKREFLTKVGEELVGNQEGRLHWMELFRTINELLPRDPKYPDFNFPSPTEYPLDKRRTVVIDKVDTKRHADLATWFTPLKTEWQDRMRTWQQLTGKELPISTTIEEDPGPTGPGWVITLTGYHYYNSDRSLEGPNFVLTTVYDKFLTGTVDLPMRRVMENGVIDEKIQPLTVKQLGITYPVMLKYNPRPKEVLVGNPEYDPTALPEDGVPPPPPTPPPAGTSGTNKPVIPKDPRGRPQSFEAKRFDFTLEFCWKETTVAEREEMQKKMEEEKAANNPPSGEVAMN